MIFFYIWVVLLIAFIVYHIPQPNLLVHGSTYLDWLVYAYAISLLFIVLYLAAEKVVE